eukprot:10812676-Heterocapsa_arctica.AAC.1
MGPKAKRVNSVCDVPALPTPSSHDDTTCQFCFAPFKNTDKASIHSKTCDHMPYSMWNARNQFIRSLSKRPLDFKC